MYSYRSLCLSAFYPVEKGQIERSEATRKPNYYSGYSFSCKSPLQIALQSNTLCNSCQMNTGVWSLFCFVLLTKCFFFVKNKHYLRGTYQQTSTSNNLLLIIPNLINRTNYSNYKFVLRSSCFPNDFKLPFLYLKSFFVSLKDSSYVKTTTQLIHLARNHDILPTEVLVADKFKGSPINTPAIR